jgi:hypothetical protein
MSDMKSEALGSGDHLIFPIARRLEMKLKVADNGIHRTRSRVDHEEPERSLLVARTGRFATRRET